MAKPLPPGAEILTSGNARVKVYPRRDGRWDVSWRESGKWKTSTRKDKEGKGGAMDFARAKVKALAAATGAQWVDPAAADAVKALKVAAGADGIGGVVTDAVEALKVLGGRGRLVDAARWYVEHGPGDVERCTLKDAVQRYLRAQRDQGRRRESLGPITGDLEGLGLTKVGTLQVIELKLPILQGWISRGQVTARTRKNRKGTWMAFLNWCRDAHLLPKGKPTIAEGLKHPRVEESSKEILELGQARRLLELVRAREPNLLPYFVVAAWAGLRPSECQRLRWEDVDLERGYIHVLSTVAKKTGTDRYVPLCAAAVEILRAEAKRAKSRQRSQLKVCEHRSREFLSRLARAEKVLAKWPADVLRHSYCSYRIAETQSMAQVAEEAGNSVPILKKYYKRPLRKEDGAEWFGLLNDLPRSDVLGS